MATEFKLPDLGEGVESATVAEIHVSEGDTIEAEQVVMELETEKAVADLPCPHTGTIQKIEVSEGDEVQIGDLLLTIEDEQGEEKTEEPSKEQAEKQETKEEQTEQADEEESERQEKKKEQREAQPQEAPEEEETAEEPQEGEPAKAEKEKPTKPAKSEKSQTEETKAEKAAKPKRKLKEKSKKAQHKETKDWQPEPAGPATRRLARKLDVNLEEVDGSGRGGRITQDDVVKAHHGDGKGQVPAMPKLPDFEQDGPVERQPLNRIEKPAVENLSRSWQAIPRVTQHGLADITDLEQDRLEFNRQVEKGKTKISMTAIAVKAVTAALADYPRFNSSLDARSQEILLKRYYHIGIAVDTEDGLLVPVVRNAESKSIVDIAEEIQSLAKQARDGKLSAEAMRGATFTISNQGPIAGENSDDELAPYDIGFTPIIPWPQVAILGISPARKQLLVLGEEPQVRLVLPLSLSYDHRVINGADAARFLRHLVKLFSESFQLLIES